MARMPGSLRPLKSWRLMAESLENVERELAKLRMNDDGTLGLRASVLNLIVVTDEESAEEVTRTISELADRYPSRTIVLISDPDGEKNLEVSLAAFCSLRGGASRNVCSEQITVHAEGPPALHLESVAGPLLIPDLPTFLFYPGDFPAISSPEFARVARLADRVILDSASGREAAFREMSILLEDPETPPAGDLQWAALSPWRALAKELFGTPERAEELRNIREVEVMHARDGESRAMLFAGWLSSSLGWEPKSHRRSEAGRELVFEGPSGEITFETSPSSHDTDLSRITLRTEECTFLISRHKELAEAHISVERGGETVAHRAVRIGRFDMKAMLGEELKYRKRDPIHEASLGKVMEILDT